MGFSFSHHNLTKKEKIFTKIFEFLPGLISWAVLIIMIVLPFFKPFLAAMIMIAFLVFWLLRLIYLSLFLKIGYKIISYEKEIDWVSRIKGLDNIYEYWKKLNQITVEPTFKNKFLFELHREELRILEKSKQFPVPSKEIYHLVLVTVGPNPQKNVSEAILSIFRGNFPLERILIVVAIEEKTSEVLKEQIRNIKKKYADHFLDLLMVIFSGRSWGTTFTKSENFTYASKKAVEYFENNQIPLDKVIVSCFNADDLVHYSYLSCLSYYYMVQPARLRICFQAIPVYQSAILEKSVFLRSLYAGSLFLPLAEATDPEKLVTFSNFSMSLKTLIDLGYWPEDIVSYNSAFFWKAFIHFNGSFKVIPMQLPFYLDAEKADTWSKTISEVYRKNIEFSWSIENFPIVMRAFLTEKEIPVQQKIKSTLSIIGRHVFRATWPILLVGLSWFAVICVGREFSRIIFYYSAERIEKVITILVLLNFICCIFLTLLSFPQRKERHNLIKGLGETLGFILVFPFSIIMSALAELSVQTKLMFGKYSRPY